MMPGFEGRAVRLYPHRKVEQPLAVIESFIMLKPVVRLEQGTLGNQCQQRIFLCSEPLLGQQ